MYAGRTVYCESPQLVTYFKDKRVKQACTTYAEREKGVGGAEGGKGDRDSDSDSDRDRETSERFLG